MSDLNTMLDNFQDAVKDAATLLEDAQPQGPIVAVLRIRKDTWVSKAEQDKGVAARPVMPGTPVIVRRFQRNRGGGVSIVCEPVRKAENNTLYLDNERVYVNRASDLVAVSSDKGERMLAKLGAAPQGALSQADLDAYFS